MQLLNLFTRRTQTCSPERKDGMQPLDRDSTTMTNSAGAQRKKQSGSFVLGRRGSQMQSRGRKDRDEHVATSGGDATDHKNSRYSNLNIGNALGSTPEL